MKTFKIAIKSISVFCIGLVILNPLNVNANDRDTDVLDPDMQRKVIQVGQNLLRANRTFEENSEVTQIREQIDIVRESIAVLSSSSNVSLGDGVLNSLSLQQEGVASLSQASPAVIDEEEDFKTKFSQEISDAKINLSKLSKLCEKHRKNTAEFEESLSQKTNGSSSKQFIITNHLSSETLLYLESMSTKLDEMMTLSSEERQQGLAQLSDSLKIQKLQAMKFEPSESTPTLSTLTSHR